MSTEQKPLTPLTATEFHFAELRSYLSGFWQGREFLAEFDAREVTHAATREQLKEANEIIERVGQEADHFCKQADLLREQLAEAQKDTERLNWLVDNTVSISAHQHSNCSGDVYVKGKQYRASTLREAIDAAMEANTKALRTRPGRKTK